MAESGTPPARVHRVTTRRRTLRPLTCPLEPELLIAEFADELPPDITVAVREHVAVCATCGARSLALKNPYQLLAGLGDEPVRSIPDLRDTIQAKVRAHPALRVVRHAANSLGRNGILAITAILGLGLLVFFVAVVFLLPASAQTAARSANGLKNVPAAGKSGVLYAETGKLVTVTDRAGNQWQVAEIIAADEPNGAIARSMPDSTASLHVAETQLLPVGVRVIGGTIAELSAPGHDGRQALVVFDSQTGQVRFVTPISLPGGKALPGPADALAVAADGSAAYIGIPQSAPTKAGVRVVVVDLKTGAITRALKVGLSASIPLPPPPGSLPASGFPSSIPHLNAAGMAATLGLNGALVLSPDGQWLFDVVILTNGHGTSYGVIRRIAIKDGAVAQELAIPGDFSHAELAASLSTQNPQVYLVHGSPGAECYVLDASAHGPVLIGDIPLGGPVASAGTTFSGTLVLAPSNDGARLSIGQDVTRSDGRGSGHDLWVVDTQGMGLAAHNSDPILAGAPLPNALGSGQSGMFVLRNGQVALLAADLSGNAAPWLRLSDGHPVVALLAVAAR